MHLFSLNQKQPENKVQPGASPFDKMETLRVTIEANKDYFWFRKLD